MSEKKEKNGPGTILGTKGSIRLDGDAFLALEVHIFYLCIDAPTTTHIVDLVNPRTCYLFIVTESS